MWKLPLDSIAESSMSTSGLSAALLSSSSTWSRAARRAASAAPCTCVMQRNDSGSWTRRAAPALPQRAAGEQLGHALRDHRLPRAGRAACTRGSSGLRLARKPFERKRGSHVQRVERRGGSRAATSAAWPTVAALALISASPSFARERDRLKAGARQRFRARQDVALEFGFAFADQRQRQMRKRREIGDADRADRRHHADARAHSAARAALRAPPAKHRSRPPPCPRHARTSSPARRRVASAGRRPPRGRAPRAAGNRLRSAGAIGWPVLAPSAELTP